MATQIQTAWSPAVKATTKTTAKATPARTATPIKLPATTAGQVMGGVGSLTPEQLAQIRAALGASVPHPSLVPPVNVGQPIFTTPAYPSPTPAQTNAQIQAGLQKRVEPFYNPGQFVAPGTDYANTEVVNGPSGYLETNPTAAFNRFLGTQGIGLANNSNEAQFARNQYNNTQTGYKSALADDPNLLYQNYLKQTLNANQLQRMFSALTPSQRNERTSSFAGPARTIADL